MAIPADRYRQAALFALLAALALWALGALYEVNRVHLARNAEAWLARRIAMALPPGSFDNDPLRDRIVVVSPDRLGTNRPVPVYRARLRGMPAAAVLLPSAAGYGGPIRLLVAIGSGGTILSVQVLEHSETPGLGDAFAVPGDTWLHAFAGRSLTTHGRTTVAWDIRRHGGDFDGFTGASITPRAIVKAVQRALEYATANEEALYAPAPQ